MKQYFGILILSMLFMTLFSGCEKTELLEYKTVYGEAIMNDKTLYQYTTIGEGISNEYWYLPLGQDNNFIIKDDVCYIQMFLRNIEDKESENFWLILVGYHVDENFPKIGKEYKIVVENQVELGNIYNSFYWSGELRDFYTIYPLFESYGVAGLSVPPSHDEFIPLEGSIQFLQGDEKTDGYSIVYNFNSKDNSNSETYHIKGTFNGKLKTIY